MTMLVPITLGLVALAVILPFSLPAPVTEKTVTKEGRKDKALQYFDYFQPEDLGYENEFEAQSEYGPVDVEENELSRAVPTRKRVQTNRPFNSPIYYIRLPPQPYMFIPGLGYISQPSPHPMNQFLNVPVSFISNGKPSGIYQWSGGLQQFPGVAPQPPPVAPQKPRPQDSTVHRLPGQYSFNGKPDDIYVLRDSYNSLYSDALQNFYP